CGLDHGKAPCGEKMTATAASPAAVGWRDVRRLQKRCEAPNRWTRIIAPAVPAHANQHQVWKSAACLNESSIAGYCQGFMNMPNPTPNTSAGVVHRPGRSSESPV